MFGKYKANFEFFKGYVSNCRETIITRYGPDKYYKTFDIGGATFKSEGEFPFSNGDKVAIYATLAKEGYYEIRMVKNFTRAYAFSKDSVTLGNFFEVFITDVILALLWAIFWGVIFGTIAYYGLQAAVLGVESFSQNVSMDLNGYIVITFIVGLIFFVRGAFKIGRYRSKISKMYKEIKQYPNFE